MYPRLGELVKIPSSCDLEIVLKYEPFESSGAYFSCRNTCGDAVASLLVKGGSTEIEKNIRRAVEWFVCNSRWKT